MSKVILRLATPAETERFFKDLSFDGSTMSIETTDRENAKVLDEDQLDTLSNVLAEAGVNHTMIPVG